MCVCVCVNFILGNYCIAIETVFIIFRIKQSGTRQAGKSIFHKCRWNCYIFVQKGVIGQKGKIFHNPLHSLRLDLPNLF